MGTPAPHPTKGRCHRRRGRRWAVVVLSVALLGWLFPWWAPAASAAAAPWIKLSPPSGPPGTHVVVTGGNWPPGDSVVASWPDRGFYIAGSATSQSDGSIRIEFDWPTDASPGAHQVAVIDNTQPVDNPSFPEFTVTAGTETTTAPNVVDTTTAPQPALVETTTTQPPDMVDTTTAPQPALVETTQPDAVVTTPPSSIGSPPFYCITVSGSCNGVGSPPTDDPLAGQQLDGLIDLGDEFIRLVSIAADLDPEIEFVNPLGPCLFVPNGPDCYSWLQKLQLQPGQAGGGIA